VKPRPVDPRLAASHADPIPPWPPADLATRFAARHDTEANYYRAVWYAAGALWFVGAGDQALAALNELFARTMAKANGGDRDGS
jgi:hypothetical protein